MEHRAAHRRGGKRRIRRRSIHITAWALSSIILGLTPLAPLAAQADGAEDAAEVLSELTGKEMVLSGDAAPVEDGVGDATTRAGDPATIPQGADITSADWYEVNSAVVASAVAEFCANGMELRGITAVCPEDMTAIETAARFIYVEARTSGTMDPALISQFVFLWAEPGLPTYDGASGDPNTNQTDSIDFYRLSPADRLVLGRTSFREEGFLFEAAFAGALAFYGPTFIAFLIPEESLLGECLNVAVALISGNAIDKADLPPTPSGTFAEATAEEPAVTTTKEEPTATEDEPTAVEEEEPDVAAGELEPAPISEDQGSGIPPAVWIAILIVALGGGIAFFLWKRASEECPEELQLLNEAMERLRGNEEKLGEARARLAGAEARGADGQDEQYARNEVAAAEAQVERDRQSVEGAQYILDVCMGLVEPRGAGVSEVPETPSSRPTTVIDSSPPPAVVSEPSPPPPPVPVPPPPPPKEEGDDPRDTPPPIESGCDERDPPRYEAFGGAFAATLALHYDLRVAAEGIRRVQESEEVAQGLEEVADALSSVGDATEALGALSGRGGSSSGSVGLGNALEAARSVLEATATLGAAAARFAKAINERNEMYQLEGRLQLYRVEMQWMARWECVDKKWVCVGQELWETKFAADSSIQLDPKREFTIASRRAAQAMIARFNVIQGQWERRTQADQAKLDAYLAKGSEGPCP